MLTLRPLKVYFLHLSNKLHRERNCLQIIGVSGGVFAVLIGQFSSVFFFYMYSKKQLMFTSHTVV